MKAELTHENRLRFESLYIGQDVFRSSKEPDESGILTPRLLARPASKYDWLSLKPLSKISDEEVDFIATILNPDRINRHNPKVLRTKECAFINFQGYEVATVFFDGAVMYKDLNGVDTYTLKALNVYDFLRSRGYALPWMGLSVDELIKAGWIRLV